MVKSLYSPQSQHVLILDQRHDGPVYSPVVCGVPDVKVNESATPLFDQQLQPVSAAAGHAAPAHIQVLNVPARQPDQGAVGDALAAPDVEYFELVRLLKDPLNLSIVHAVKVTSLVHSYSKLLKERKAWGCHLLLYRGIIKSQHRVGGPQLPQLGTTLLNLFNVDEDRVSGGG